MVISFIGLIWSDRYHHEGVAYAFSESRAHWSAARDSCHEEGAKLAIITSSSADVFLRELCPDPSKTYDMQYIVFIITCHTNALQLVSHETQRWIKMVEDGPT